MCSISYNFDRMASRLKKTQLSSLTTNAQKKVSDKSIEEQIY